LLPTATFSKTIPDLLLQIHVLVYAEVCFQAHQKLSIDRLDIILVTIAITCMGLASISYRIVVQLLINALDFRKSQGS
jgi:hypothetical protein